jgi:hypothetical protein
MTVPRRAPNMPQLHPAAWHGHLGEIVGLVAPCTEADPAAVLASLLAIFGALAGDGPHVRVGGVRHPARIWPLVVGKTGSGRKGTSFAEARAAARGWSSYADRYTHDRMVSGLASGEGLIAALGGAVGDSKPDEQAEAVAPDGRLFVTETEFARVLAAAKRDGSTLGPILRQLWDDGSAAILTRAAPLRVDGAHLGMIAHVTPRELRLRLAESDLAGGTLNRFLLIASERPQLLSHELPHPALELQARMLGKALDACRMTSGEVRRDKAADALWTDVYAALNAEEPDGQLGSVLARGPAYTMRLALTFALADNQMTIGVEHLLAALAVWQYAVASARMVFPEGQAAVILHRLLAFVQAGGQAGRTRTEISHHFGRNYPVREIEAHLDELERHAYLTQTQDAPTGPGRPTIRVRWTGRHRDQMMDLLNRVLTTH